MLRIFNIKIKAKIFEYFTIMFLLALIIVSILINEYPLGFSIKKILLINTLKRPIIILFLMNILYRSITFFLYKPQKLINYTPKISIVIPVYNEGYMIKKSLESALAADYPAELKEVICINDGSTDDTSKYIDEVVEEYGPKLKLINFEKNRGKRAALAEGFKLAKGEIVVTLDSDSVLQMDSLLHLVIPFTDSSVGAVTGSVTVYNKNTNLLTRMVGVRYIIAFDFLRATQSTISTVFCCSGVLSAYRKSVLDIVTEEWLNQKFLNDICTYGDDRALSNLVLKNGYNTVYARKAFVQTVVPENIIKLMKMFARWNKSFIRESIFFFGFAFTKYRTGNRILPLVDYFMQISIFVMQFYCYAMMVYCVFLAPLLILKYLYYIAIVAAMYLFVYLRMVRNFDFVYGILYAYLSFFLLFWTVPYSIITLKNKSWLTR